jgi:hypothetical protein
MMKGGLIRTMNEGYARLRLKDARIEELPIEVEQLRKAIEAVHHRVDFDTDPHDFRAALREVAGERRDD